MAKLFAWEQVQTLWTKIKNTFVAKDSSGNVTVNGDTTLNGATTFGGFVDIKGGKPLNFWNSDNTKSSSVSVDNLGTLKVGGQTIATETYVTNAVANAGHLKREKVDVLPGVSTAKENVIYIVPASDGSFDDVFDEYMLINGKLEKMGSSRVDLSGYSTTEQMNTAISTAVSNSYTLITDAEINALS